MSAPTETRRFRWNSTAAVWEFYEEAWGGWCVLRATPSDASPPMGYVDGAQHVANQQQRHASGFSAFVEVSYV